MAFRSVNSSEPVGKIIDHSAAAPPSGYLFLSGETIGNISSGAQYASDLYKDLFIHLWNNYADAEASVSGGRGASGSADWSANKTINLLDYRGRSSVGKDDMGASGAANRMTSGFSGIDGSVLGRSGGSQVHSLSEPEMPNHAHSTSDPGHRHMSVNSAAGAGISYPTAGTSMFRSTTTGGAGDYNLNSTSNEPDTNRSSNVATGLSVLGAGSSNSHQNTQPSIINLKAIRY